MPQARLQFRWTNVHLLKDVKQKMVYDTLVLIFNRSVPQGASLLSLEMAQYGEGMFGLWGWKVLSPNPTFACYQLCDPGQVAERLFMEKMGQRRR